MGKKGGDDRVVCVKCADVVFDMGVGSYERNLGWWEGGGLGSLIWNPKGGCGCDGFLGKCDNVVDVCECGEDNSYRDHHYALLRAQ